MMSSAAASRSDADAGLQVGNHVTAHRPTPAAGSTLPTVDEADEQSATDTSSCTPPGDETLNDDHDVCEHDRELNEITPLDHDHDDDLHDREHDLTASPDDDDVDEPIAVSGATFITVRAVETDCIVFVGVFFLFAR